MTAADTAGRRWRRRRGGGSGPQGEMTLLEHLDELRSRLFKAALALAAAFAVGFVLREQVLEVLLRPYCDLDAQLRQPSEVLNPDTCTLYHFDVLGQLAISIKAAAIVAVVIAAPVVAYQVLRFVTPGLRPVERRYAVPFVLISGLLFAGGAAFAYVVVPMGLEFLLGFAGDRVQSIMDVSAFLTFMLQVMAGFGLAFEIPLILVTLVLMDVLTADTLRRWRRGAMVAAFVIAAIVTPADPFTMVLMAAPLIVFYEVCVLIARGVARRRGRAAS